MSINESLTNDDRAVADPNGPLTVGILSLALGLTAATGGGTWASAFQYWSFDLIPMGNPGSSVVQTLPAIPSIVLGIVAVVLGLLAARSSHGVASATGKAGAVIGMLAVVGSIAMAVAILSSDLY